MAKKVDLVRPQGAGTEHRNGYVGFSWLTLFFSWIVAICRKDWKWAVIMFLVPKVIGFLLGFAISLFMAFLGIPQEAIDIVVAGVYWLMVSLPLGIYFGYVYNKKYTEKLLAEGFKPIDIFAARALEEAGLIAAPASAPQSSGNTSGIRSRLAAASSTPKNAGDMVKQGLALLERSEFGQAEALFEQALELNPKASAAYIGVLMAEQKVRNVSELVGCPILLEDDALFREAVECASPKMKQTLDKYAQLNRAKFSSARH